MPESSLPAWSEGKEGLLQAMRRGTWDWAAKKSRKQASYTAGRKNQGSMFTFRGRRFFKSVTRGVHIGQRICRWVAKRVQLFQPGIAGRISASCSGESKFSARRRSD